MNADPDEMVAIWSEEHHAYWRPEANGYTTHVASLGLWRRAEAESMVAHCGPEKQIELRPWPLRLDPDRPAGETALASLARKIERWASLVAHDDLAPKVALAQILIDVTDAVAAERE